MRAPKELLRPRAGWVVWTIFFAVVVTLVVVQSGRRVDRVYLDAARGWWASQDVYGGGGKGYLYLPSFAFLYTPFTFEPRLLAEVLWRLVGLLAFTTGLWRVVRRAAPAPGAFLAATVLALGAAWAATRNGQSNVHLAGALLHAGVELAAARWWRVAALLALALVLKPVALPFLLVVAVVWPRTSWRIALALVIAVVVSFLHPDPGYVVRMHEAAWHKMLTASQPGERPYNDWVAMLRTVGVEVPEAVKRPVILVAGIGALAAAWLARRRLPPREAALSVFAMLAAWLMFFSPRTESNTYVVLVPWIATSAVASFLRGRRGESAFLAALALLLGCDVVGWTIHRATDHWLKPLVALAFLVWWIASRMVPRGRVAGLGSSTPLSSSPRRE